MQSNININRPVGAGNNVSPIPPASAQQAQQSAPLASASNPKLPWIVLAAAVIIVLAVLGFIFRDKLGFAGKTTDKLSGYQAVFLTNGQVYFGRVKNLSSDYVTLRDIYYLQANQPLQSGQPGQNQQQQQPQLSLVKLGNELHGPVDLMYINRSQILFYEDLKAEGKVAQAIAAYKSGNQGVGQQPPQQPAGAK